MMATEAKKSRKALTLEQKCTLIQESKQPGFQQYAAAEKLGISTSSVSKILKNQSSILDAFDSGHNNNQKRMVSGKEAALEADLYKWIVKTQRKGFPISGPLIIAKAQELHIAAHHQLTSTSSSDSSPKIKFSTGWLDRFKKRYNLQFKKFHGEKQDANEDAAQEWLDKNLPELLSRFEPEDIYNADETGLYYRGLPDQGFVPGDVSVPSGGKLSKERLTIMVTCNMTGCDKRPLLMIGKSERPRGFPQDLSKLPVIYRSAGRAWMNAALFSMWLKRWDRELRLSGRKILLLVDNAPSHPQIGDELANICLEFLPKNTT